MLVSFHPWLSQAERDLKAAESAFYDGDERNCSLLARQASEKALLGYYVKLTGRLPEESSRGVGELVEFLKLAELKQLMAKWDAELSQLAPDDRSLKLSRKILDWIEWKLQ